MKDMFFHCLSLSYLSDISKWNTSKVTNMSGMLGGCSLLESIPDISNGIHQILLI